MVSESRLAHAESCLTWSRAWLIVSNLGESRLATIWIPHADSTLHSRDLNDGTAERCGNYLTNLKSRIWRHNRTIEKRVAKFGRVAIYETDDETIAVYVCAGFVPRGLPPLREKPTPSPDERTDAES